MYPVREGVDEWDNVEEEERRNRGLVVQQLHARHLQLSVIAGNPDGIERRGKDTRKRKEDTERRRRLDICVGTRQRVVVRYHAYAQARRDQCNEGITREGGLVEDKVHQGHRGGEQDAGDLVEGDGGEGE